ncbi:MAG: hypothetical protein ACTS6G_01425, partial [Candidatus Hodgkinia cicadicola]
KCPFGPRREQLTFASCSDGNIPAHWTLNRKVLSSRCAGWKFIIMIEWTTKAATFDLTFERMSCNFGLIDFRSKHSAGNER